MSRFKPISLMLMFMPITLFVLLIIYIYQRRQDFDVVFSFSPDSPASEEPFPETGVGEAPQSSKKKADDLKKIEGIGPKIASVLDTAGISTYASLAHTNVETLTNLLRKAGIRVAFPKTWPKQARLAAAEEWETLTEYQATLVGGREK